MKRTQQVTWYGFVHKHLFVTTHYIVFINNKMLGTLAMIGAPFLVLDCLWLPFTIVLNAIDEMNANVIMVSGLYAAISWAVLGYVVYTSPAPDKLRYAPVVV